MNKTAAHSWTDFIPRKIGLVIQDQTLEKLLEYGLKNDGYLVQHLMTSVSPSLKSIVDLIITDSLDILQEFPFNCPVLILYEATQAGNVNESLRPNVFYLEKPFDFLQLLSLIKSMTVREESFAHGLQLSRTQQAYRFQDIELYPVGLEIDCSNQRIKLTKREYQVFVALLQGYGHVVPASELTKLMPSQIVNRRASLTQCLFYLREKLMCCSDRIQIKTKINEGYQLQISM